MTSAPSQPTSTESPAFDSLEFAVGLGCPNRCVFCSEAGFATRLPQESVRTVADLKEHLAKVEGIERIQFGGQEPLTNPELPQMIATAKAHGARDIGLITSGRGLGRSQPSTKSDLLSRLVSAGLNTLEISLHGHSADLHDALTATPGSFDDTLAAISYASELRRAGAALRLTIQTTLVRDNLPHIPELLAVLAPYRPDGVVGLALQLMGRAGEQAETLTPAYQDIIRQAQIWDKQDLPLPLTLSGLPPCLNLKLPARFQGRLNRVAFVSRDDRVIGGQAGNKQYGLPCRACVAKSFCEGVEIAYWDLFGWDEFAPIDDTSWQAIVSQTHADRQSAPLKPFLTEAAARALVHPFSETNAIGGWRLTDVRIEERAARLIFTREDGQRLPVRLVDPVHAPQAQQQAGIAICYDGERLERHLDKIWRTVSGTILRNARRSGENKP